MHGRMPVIAQRDVAELNLRFGLGLDAHLIATSTATQSPALTISAAPSRAATVMRRIDHGAGCAGCGVAGPWLWVCPWLWACPWGPWSWEWEWAIQRCYIIT